MKRNTWVQLVLAAVLVLVVGVVFADTETVKVKVKKTDADHEVMVDVDGDAQVFTLADFADGEQREFASGEHTITVRREGQELHVTLDGEPLGMPGGEQRMIWISEDGEQHEISGGAKKVIVVKGDGAHAAALGEGMMFVTADASGGEELELEIEEILGGQAAGERDRQFMVFKHRSGEGGPVVVDLASRADMVTYRCEETGSELTVKKEHAAYDTYTDPATGCVMTKVEPRVIAVTTVVETDTTKSE